MKGQVTLFKTLAQGASKCHKETELTLLPSNMKDIAVIQSTETSLCKRFLLVYGRRASVLSLGIAGSVSTSRTPLNITS